MKDTATSGFALVDAGDVNTMRKGALDELSADTRKLVERRAHAMGPAYRLHYTTPLHLVRGKGTRVFDADGVEYLDAYNNVVSLGHGHPAVINAMKQQFERLNSNTRYLIDNVIDYAEDLVSTHAGLDVAMFTCSGSEANDLAMRMAREATGGSGVVVSSYAYHGCTRDTASWSPASLGGRAGSPEVRLVPPPDTFRGDPDLAAERFAEAVETQIHSLRSAGIKFAALVVDCLFSSDGVHPDARSLSLVEDVVHLNGGLLIADEVQAGFGRTGAAMWGYQRSGISPDLVTMGKPMANGVPVAGVVARDDVASVFGERVSYFNTFGGESAMIAAAQAVLDVVRDENLTENAARQGRLLMTHCIGALESASLAADVRGTGLYIGIELVTDLETKAPAPAQATFLANAMREAGVLISSVGPYGNVLKIRPPLVFDNEDVAWFTQAFDRSVSRLASTK